MLIGGVDRVERSFQISSSTGSLIAAWADRKNYERRHKHRGGCLRGALVFGGIVGQDDSRTVYAGSLDDPSTSEPKIAIFNRDRPRWAVLPPRLAVFETYPMVDPRSFT